MCTDDGGDGMCKIANSIYIMGFAVFIYLYINTSLSKTNGLRDDNDVATWTNRQYCWHWMTKQYTLIWRNKCSRVVILHQVHIDYSKNTSIRLVVWCVPHYIVSHGCLEPVGPMVRHLCIIGSLWMCSTFILVLEEKKRSKMWWMVRFLFFYFFEGVNCVDVHMIT